MANCNKSFDDIHKDLRDAHFTRRKYRHSKSGEQIRGSDDVTGGHYKYYFYCPDDIANGVQKPKVLLTLQLAKHSKDIKKGTLNGIYKKIDKARAIMQAFDEKNLEGVRTQQRQNERAEQERKDSLCKAIRKRVRFEFKMAGGRRRRAMKAIKEKGIDMTKLNIRSAKPLPQLSG